MEVKKSKKADLENRRGLFMEIGLIVALAAVIIMFSVSPRAFIKIKTERMQTGMEMTMVMVAPPRRRNTSTTMAASSTPWRMFWKADSTERLM